MNSPKFSAENIKVLRIIARLNIGGPAIHTILLSSHLERLGYRTVLVAGQVDPDEGDMNYLAEAEGVEPIIIPRLGRRLLPLSDFAAFLCILRLLFSRRPQIVHTHTAKAGAVGRLAALIYNKAQGARQKAHGFVVRIIPSKRTQESEAQVTNTKCKVVHTFHGHVLHARKRR